MSVWKREVNKKQRMLGQKYAGYRKEEEKYVPDSQKEDRKLSPVCSSNFCKTKKIFECSVFTNEIRQQIFDTFWKMTWDEKRVFVISLIDVRARNRVTQSEDSRRSESRQYFLKIDNIKKRICQKMFLNTLGIKEWTVRYWLKKHNTNNPFVQNQIISRDINLKVNDAQKKETIKEFLTMLPKLPSHYCRSSSSKLFLEPTIQTKMQLYRIYTSYAEEKGLDVACRKTFEDTLATENVSLFKPKKDECDTCCAYKVGNVSEEDYSFHLELKDSVRKEKEFDKKQAIKGEIHVLTADVQAVQLCPFLNASTLYFKTKLAVHNFSIYNLGNNRVMCYWFDETQADLKATTFASCFEDYLSKLIDNEPKPIY